MKSFLRLLVLSVLGAIFATPAVARDYDHCARGAYGPVPYGGYSRGYAPVIDYRYARGPGYGYAYAQAPRYRVYPHASYGYRNDAGYRPRYGYRY